MGLRKASAYSRKTVRPYTRKSSRRTKAYIKAVPASKIVKFNMGDKKGFVSDKHKYKVEMTAIERVQMRDNSIESCRMFLSKRLDKKIPGEYALNIKIFPHHILRENKTAAGAGADRLSSGMKHSFGVTVGRAALIRPGKELFVVYCTDDRAARAARDALSVLKSKVPCRSKISIVKLV